MCPVCCVWTTGACKQWVIILAGASVTFSEALREMQEDLKVAFE